MQVDPRQQPRPPSGSQGEQQVRHSPCGPASSGGPASNPASSPLHSTEQLGLSNRQPCAQRAHSVSKTEGTQREPPVKLLHVEPGPQSAAVVHALAQVGGFSQVTSHCAPVWQ